MAKFELPNKKVKVKPNFDNPGWIKNSKHVAFFKVEGAYESYPVAMSRNGQLKNPFTDDEKKALEEIMGYEPNSLSVYNKTSILHETNVRLTREPLELNLSDPLDYIKYKVLLTNTDKIAPSLKEKTKKATYKFYIEDAEDVIELQSKTASTQQIAWKEYGKVEDNRAKLTSFLKVYGQIMKMPLLRVNKDTKLAFLQAKVSEIVQSKPKDFVEIVTDEDFDIMLLISRAVETGVIKRDGTAYLLNEGDKLGNTLKATINYLKAASSQEIALIIENQVKLKEE